MPLSWISRLQFDHYMPPLTVQTESGSVGKIHSNGAHGCAEVITNPLAV